MYVSCMLLEQPKEGRYAKNAGAVFNLSYHVVWCPKYGRKVLVGDVEQRLKHILYARAQQYGVLSPQGSSVESCGYDPWYSGGIPGHCATAPSTSWRGRFQ